MKENPKISVAMAVFNGEKYLKDQIFSILIQLKENDILVIEGLHALSDEILSDIPKKKKFTIAKLIDYDPQKDIVDPLKQGTIKTLVSKVCKKLGIQLTTIDKSFGGLAYNVTHRKDILKKPVRKCTACGYDKFFEIKIVDEEIKTALGVSPKKVKSYVCEKCGIEFTTKKPFRKNRKVKCGNCIQKRKHVQDNPDSIMELSKRTISKILHRSGVGCAICGWNESTCDIHHIIELVTI